MRSEFAFLFPKPARKPRKAAVKSVRTGARIILSVDGKEYTVRERDTRYRNAWFLDGAEYSFSRDMLKVL